MTVQEAIPTVRQAIRNAVNAKTSEEREYWREEARRRYKKLEARRAD